MAILEKIRRRSTLLIFVIGLSLFAFIISDIIKNRSMNIGGASSEIGSVNGEPIPLDDFRTLVNNGSKNNSDQMSVVNYIWSFQVEKKLINQNCDDIGLHLDRALLDEIVNSSEEYKGYYTSVLDKDRSFDFGEYLKIINSIRSSNPDNYEQWIKQEDYVLDQERSKIYKMLVRSGLQSSSVEDEMGYHLSKDSVDISFVKMSYNKIADSLVRISDREISEYIKAHKKEYKQKSSVALKYVFFEEKASDADETALKDQLEQLLSPRVEYNNISEKNDTLPSFKEIKNYKDFVNNNSDEAFKDKYLFKNQLSKEFLENIINLKNNEVFGPYKDKEYYKLTRKIESIKLADSVKSSHIIVPFLGSQSSSADSMTKKEAKKYIDSIFRLVRGSKAKFTKVADSINTDGTKGRGGDIGWTVYSKINNQSFDKKFSDYIFFNKVNSIGIVESKFGYHIIRVDKKGPRKRAYKLAYITRRIAPSEKTINEVFRKASSFELDVTEHKKTFEEAVEGTEYKILNSTKTEKMTSSLQQIDTPRPLVRWAFNDGTDLKDVKRFNMNNGYVVVRLTKRTKDGIMGVSDARNRIEPILKKKKKAEKIRIDYKEKSFEELSNSEDWESSTANNLTLKNTNIPNSGREPKVVGTAFSIDEGETSGLIEGANSMYMLKVIKNKKAEPLEKYTNYTNTILPVPEEYFLNQKLIKSLKLASDIEDDRILFY